MSLESLYNKVINLKNIKLKKEIIKSAQQDSFFQQNTKIDEATREKRLRDGIELNQKYNLNRPEAVHPSNDVDDVLTQQVSLSTRYAPDMPGVQAMRVSDGVFQNPYSGKMYDYNEGFSVDGLNFQGGSPSLQTDIMTLAKEFKRKGLHKEARLLKLFAKDM
jgi:hypothetical protein